MLCIDDSAHEVGRGAKCAEVVRAAPVLVHPLCVTVRTWRFLFLVNRGDAELVAFPVQRTRSFANELRQRITIRYVDALELDLDSIKAMLLREIDEPGDSSRARCFAVEKTAGPCSAEQACLSIVVLHLRHHGHSMLSCESEHLLLDV